MLPKHYEAKTTDSYFAPCDEISNSLLITVNKLRYIKTFFNYYCYLRGVNKKQTKKRQQYDKETKHRNIMRTGRLATQEGRIARTADIPEHYIQI